LDSDCSGSLDYEEVMKYYDVKFSEHRMIEIFSKYDIDGSCEMNLQEFEQAIEYIREPSTSY
jgi:Ca2+-binding EF-hand superfamily protein